MLARCARCQGTFSTDHFGLQTCPHCGAELMLSDPNAPKGAQPPAPPPEKPSGTEAPEAPPSPRPSP
ncbi:MAG TPA: YIP1 family protein, partial [Anaeromyxobacteraceae bacterium]|nr:YIP1 family protein [Anaeromyxobacteraceae bacterium]